jgi:hypothetical protein
MGRKGRALPITLLDVTKRPNLLSWRCRREYRTNFMIVRSGAEFAMLRLDATGLFASVAVSVRGSEAHYM